MKITDELQALDLIEDIIDMLIGTAETLRIRGAIPQDECHVCKMAASMTYSQVERLSDIRNWLEDTVENEREESDEGAER